MKKNLASSYISTADHAAAQAQAIKFIAQLGIVIRCSLKNRNFDGVVTRFFEILQNSLVFLDDMLSPKQQVQSGYHFLF